MLNFFKNTKNHSVSQKLLLGKWEARLAGYTEQLEFGIDNKVTAVGKSGGKTFGTYQVQETEVLVELDLGSAKVNLKFEYMEGKGVLASRSEKTADEVEFYKIH